MEYFIGRLSRNPTPHEIGLPAEQVFATAVDLHARWFKPFLSVDLYALNPQWRGRAHFLYCHAQTGSVYFRLGDSKYTFLGDDLDEMVDLAEIDMEDFLEEDEEDNIGDLPIENDEPGRYVELKRFELPDFRCTRATRGPRLGGS